jgi:hypothetical protein
MPPIFHLGKEEVTDKKLDELVITKWKYKKDSGIGYGMIDINTESGDVKPILQQNSSPDAIGYLNNKASQAERLVKMKLRLQNKLKNKT